jgi:diguanylate cyclase (GGDEF)-like protein
MLIAGPHAFLQRIVIAQVFMAVAVFTMFPIAALLEERAALQLSLAASEARYKELANFDELTGLYNRRAFNERLNSDWQHAMTARVPLSLVLIDADLFKSYNDVHGHLRGDECLRSIASIISATAGKGTATVARYGGEEFAVVLPGQGEEHARLLAERIRLAAVEMKLPHPCSPTGLQTVSLGVAVMTPDGSQNIAELIGMADLALYRAKGLGRNQVVVA